MKYVSIYDTTMRDGAQNPFVNLTTDGKLEATRLLNELGTNYIEGGFPQAGGQDEYFSRVRGLETDARIAAFGMTPRSEDFENDRSMKALLAANTDVVTLVAKTPEEQVQKVLGMDQNKYRNICGKAVNYLKELGKEVVLDAEHFFDAYNDNPKKAMELLDFCRGADWLVLCDTNGGAHYRELSGTVGNAVYECGDKIGVHFHNDRGLAVPNTLEALHVGALQAQGTMNGVGERAGNANLVDLAGNIYLMDELESNIDYKRLAEISQMFEKLTGWSVLSNAPFVGRLAHSHSGGMHVDAMLKCSNSYEHFSPAVFGAQRTFPISGQSGRAAIVSKLRTWGYQLEKSSPIVRHLLTDLNGRGYVGDAQFYEMFRRRIGDYKDPLVIDKISLSDTITKQHSNPEAMVKFRANGHTFLEVADGDGQVDAIDKAIRKGLKKVHPDIDKVRLLSYSVPPITSSGADASIQIRTYFGYGNGDDRASEQWDSFASGTDIIAESARALVDAYRFFLLRQEDKK
jgi:2-isopropylmalate synthase